MKPVILTVSIPASVFTCQVNSDSEVADGPSSAAPEFQVLNRYAGQWEDEISGKPSVKRVEMGEWILDGRFFRQSWSTTASEDAPKASGVTLMTFDLDTKTYRSWSFLATGSVIENEGAWDAAKQTMAWSHRLPETSEEVLTETSFIGETAQAWRIVKTDTHGKVIREVTGRSVRTSLSKLVAV